jgi:peptidyl-prolyl cis-trans isomerase B (cyclophilin B)
MATTVRRWASICGGAAATGALGLLAVAGCSRPDAPAKGNPAEPPVAHVEAPAKPEGPTAAARPVAGQTVSRVQPGHSFKESVLLEPPDTQLRPPDVTVAGKKTAQLFEAIAGRDNAGGLWDQITFVDAAGRRIDYTATLQTDLGDIVVEFFPDAAPNHVRNFIALARAGYYDGLPFHSSQRLETPEKTWAYLEAGCPKGTGEPGYGSVGYWLRPEISEKLTHDVGTVGAWHDEDPDTAAGRFYITLHKAPALDGSFTIFGKIRQGLDVAHTMNKRPVIDEYPFDRPREPVVIRQVVINTSTAQ